MWWSNYDRVFIFIRFTPAWTFILGRVRDLMSPDRSRKKWVKFIRGRRGNRNLFVKLFFPWMRYSHCHSSDIFYIISIFIWIFIFSACFSLHLQKECKEQMNRGKIDFSNGNYCCLFVKDERAAASLIILLFLLEGCKIILKDTQKKLST